MEETIKQENSKLVRAVIGLVTGIVVLAIGIATYRHEATAPLAPDIYRNSTYGFTLTLAPDWRGFTEHEEAFDIRSINATSTNAVIDHGILVTLAHPSSTTAEPYEAIPVMVFTKVQWALVSDEGGEPKASVSAAPFGPSKRGENTTYVFATAPRYNYDFAKGFEEAEEIIKTLKGF